MRLFIALPISPEVKKQLEQIQISLYNRNQSARVKWTSAGEWHITVVFLGEVDEKNIENIRNIINTVCAKYKPMNFRLDRVGGFPNILNPNVVVVKAVDESGQVEKLQKELANALRGLGIQIDDKPWKPHITIGRNKMRENLSGLDKVSIEPVGWTVREVILFESELLASGPRYTKLSYANFGS